MTDDFERYINALRGDLPTPHDERRLRQRVASAGIAVAATVVTKTAVGATGAGKVGLLPALLVRMTHLPLLTQLGLVTAGTAAVATGPVVVASHLLSRPTATQVVGPAGSTSRVRIAPQQASKHLELNAGIKPAGMDPPRLNATHAAPDPEALNRASGALVSATPAGSALALSLVDPGRRGFVKSARAEVSVQPVNTRAREPSSPLLTAGDVSQLAEETRLIDAALLSIRQGDVAATRRWLAEHAARFPHGKLAKERERAWQKLDAKNQQTQP